MQSKFCNWISCDVETGGLLSKGKKAVFDVALTEIALVAINQDLEIVEKQSWLIKPYSDTAEYNKNAEIASGISKEMCEKDGKDIKEVMKEVIQFLKRHKDGSRLPVMLGHNFVAFDSAFIANFFEYCKEDFTKYIQDEPEDTIKWARICWTDSANYKLGTCCDNANVTLLNAHRALADAVATAELWVYFLKNLRGMGGNKQVEQEVRFRDGFEF